MKTPLKEREWTEAKAVIATSSKGLIDTGADIDYISKAFFSKINKSSDYKVENTDMIFKKCIQKPISVQTRRSKF